MMKRISVNWIYEALRRVAVMSVPCLAALFLLKHFSVEGLSAAWFTTLILLGLGGELIYLKVFSAYEDAEGAKTTFWLKAVVAETLFALNCAALAIAIF